jgi:hypothetical protein
VKEGEHLQDPGVDWRIILKSILKKLDAFGNTEYRPAVINTINCGAFVACLSMLVSWLVS